MMNDESNEETMVIRKKYVSHDARLGNKWYAGASGDH